MLASASIKRMVDENRADAAVLLPPGLQEGKGWHGVRRPSLIERASSAAGELLGPAYGSLIYSLLKGCKDGQIGMYMARAVLERCLPETRPTPVTLPIIDSAQDLVEADRRLMAAANVGVISHREWSTAQQCILKSWEIRKQARLEEP